MLFLLSPTTAIWQLRRTDCCRDSTDRKRQASAVVQYGFNAVLRLKKDLFDYGRFETPR